VASLNYHLNNPNDPHRKCVKDTVLLGYRDGQHGDGQYFLTDVHEGTYIVKFDKQEVSWVTTEWLFPNEVELVLRRYEHGGTHEVCKMNFETEEWARDAARDLRMWAFGQDVSGRGYR